jgi:hypothetical protein
LPAFAAAVAVPLELLLELDLLLSLPHAATTSAAEAASTGMSRGARFIGPPPPGGHIGTGTGDELSDRRRPGIGIRHDGWNFVKNLDELRWKMLTVASDPERS